MRECCSFEMPFRTHFFDLFYLRIIQGFLVDASLLGGVPNIVIDHTMIDIV